jgi:cytochrome c-type biogenesis protein CcmE
MHPLRKRRLLVVVFILAVSSIGVALATYALRQNMNFFYTPSQVEADSVPGDVRIRVGGMVVRGSLTRTPGDLGVNFRLTDGNAELLVRYTGILPDLFGEGEAAVAAGYLRSGRVLEADQVLAKHDENYTPPEVADAMKAGHAARAARDADAPPAGAERSSAP